MSKHKNFLQFLFNSKIKAKMLKFLFRNPDLQFDAKELSIRIQEPLSEVRKEIKKFIEAGLLKVIKIKS